MPRRREPARSSRDEHIRTVHSAADRDGAADGGAAGRRHDRLQPVAGGRAADRRLSDDSVSATLPGASPEIMASSVAQPLERQFATLPGVNQITSSNVQGTTSITLQFDLSRNIDGAASDVQAAINQASGVLPKNLPNPPTYRKVNPADQPILILGLTSDVMTLHDLDQYADLN